MTFPRINGALWFTMLPLIALSSSVADTPTRLEPLADKLTIEESIDMLGGRGFSTRASARLGIPSFNMSDGPSGVRSPGPSTAYAAGIGLVATWDPELAQQVGRQLGRDARARGSHYLLGPGVNIYRAPMNGRNFVYFGEDPWLASRVAVGYIRGVQEQGVSADVAIVVVGFDDQSESEGSNRDFALPPGQDELIRAVAAVNPNTVVIVVAGGAVDVRPWLADVAGLMTVWYPGEQGGRALADLLTGAVSPSGRLPISWDTAIEQNPSYSNYYFNDPANPDRIVYREGIFVGYRGYQKLDRQPQFSFGYGLTYSSFEYTHLRFELVGDISSGQAGPLFNVRFDVTNTGKYPAADVAQLYVGATKSKVERPHRELKGSARTLLQRGERRSVVIPLDARAFAYFDVAQKRWRADVGSYRIDLARSADDVVVSSTLNLTKTLHLQP